jgi:hypothetical protein
MSSANTQTQTTKSLMISILQEDPGLNAKQAVETFKRQFKRHVTPDSYYHAKKVLGLPKLSRKKMSPAGGSYGATSSPLGVSPADSRFSPTISSPLGVAPSGPRGRSPQVAEGDSEAHAGEARFVPEELMATIAVIKKACQGAGGFDQAEKVAEIIERAGGVSNFKLAVALLRQVTDEA